MKLKINFCWEMYFLLILQFCEKKIVSCSVLYSAKWSWKCFSQFIAARIKRRNYFYFYHCHMSRYERGATVMSLNVLKCTVKYVHMHKWAFVWELLLLLYFCVIQASITLCLITLEIRYSFVPLPATKSLFKVILNMLI